MHDRSNKKCTHVNNLQSYKLKKLLLILSVVLKRKVVVRFVDIGGVVDHH
jgi:hypothetical protein